MRRIITRLRGARFIARFGRKSESGHLTRGGWMRGFARFAEATGDDQWIHVDIERARRELPYGTTIAHGLLTLSLLPSFFRTVLRVEGVKNSLNYGSNRVRYLSPVPAGSRLRGRIGIAQAVDVPPNGLRVTYHTTVELEGSERPACVADTIGVHFR